MLTQTKHYYMVHYPGNSKAFAPLFRKIHLRKKTRKAYC